MTTLRPLGQRVLIRRDDAPDEVRNGIIIPDSAKEKPQIGLVTAIGNGRVLPSGERLPLDIAVGDRVLFGKYAGADIKLDGQELLLVHEDEIMGIL